MSEQAFQAISNYCLKNNIDFPIRNQAFAIHTQELQLAIENHKRENNGRITPTEERTLQSAHVSEGAIQGYVAKAEQVVADLRTTAITPYKNRFKWSEFWTSVAASVVGAFIFVILVVLIIFVAEEQVKSIVAPLVYEEMQQVEGKVGSNKQVEPTQ